MTRATILALPAILLTLVGCLPEPEARAPLPSRNAVILSIAPATSLVRQLEADDHRVLVSGFVNESGEELLRRLPWLLQPGVDVAYYDTTLAGAAVVDTLRGYFEARGVAFRLTGSE